METTFRAYHIGEKKMYTPVCVMFCPNELRKYRIFEASDGKFLGNDKHFEIMQSTGLNDKDGDEIFEGDILSSEYKDHDSKNKNCHPVVWREHGWYCDHQVNDCCKAWRGDLASHHSSEEIIGDIYQNKELL